MTTFEALGVSEPLCLAVKEMGFECPMPVQEEVIPRLLGSGSDIIVMAQTGTGKTAAYGLPLIQQAEPSVKHPAALVLCPTRELCVQIAGDLNDFARHSGDVKVLPVYGGSSIENQIRALKGSVQVVVATPGRLMDLMERKAISLASVKKVILDEADEMLNMGFLPGIDHILSAVPDGRSTLLFSATMPNEIMKITRRYMKDPVEITIGVRNAGAENVRHFCYTVQAKDKYLAMKRIADYFPGIYGIIFCRTRRETQEIADKLIQDGYNADALHGDLSQPMRDLVMQKFRTRNIRLLVATDVAARGLDVDDLTHVIHYNLPDDHEIYTHRSGRTGRAGKAGISVAIVNLREKHLIAGFEKKLKKTFQHMPVPGGREICEKQLFYMVHEMEQVQVEHTEIDTYLPVIFRKLEWLDKEEVIRRFVSLQFNRFLEYYRNAPEILPAVRQKDSGRGEEGGRAGKKAGRERRHQATESFTSLHINAGRGDGMNPRQLIGMVNSSTPGMKVSIGRIELRKDSSVFEVESRYAREVVRLMKNRRLGKRILEVRLHRQEGKQ